MIEIIPPPAIATGQTLKQRVVWRCPNPACVENIGIMCPSDPLQLNQPGVKYFEFFGDYPECPKCGMGAPTVQKRALIHLLLRDAKGPIVGDQGFRWKMACDPRRTHLATENNGEAATGDSTCANCPGCLSAANGIVISGQQIKI